MKSPMSVQFDHVSKHFRRSEACGSLGELMGRLGRGFHPLRWLRSRIDLPAKPSSRDSFWALRDLSFDARQGEALGVIGPNGAGKSTVLKLLAGILRPDVGHVFVKGRLAALIEIGAGFHGDLSGRENIFLNGAILGMRRDEIRTKLDSIVAFAGLESFLDMPVKRYSSGMYARLGFSIAAHVEPEVLLVDEVLSVGDALFRIRCLERMRQLVRDGTTLIFVTHDLDQMRAICRRTLVLDQGRVVFEGSPSEAVGHYLGAMATLLPHRPADLVRGFEPVDSAIQLRGFEQLDKAGRPQKAVAAGGETVIRVTVEPLRPLGRLVVELNLRSAAHDALMSFNSERSGVFLEVGERVQRISLKIHSLPLAGGHYFWNVRIWDGRHGTCELDTPFRFPMVVNDHGRPTGALCVEHSWHASPDPANLESVPIDVQPRSEDSSVHERQHENLSVR